jgi:hypothetical protein
MSDCGPLKGTLLVNPLLKLATAYTLLRPFFRPVRSWNRGADLVDPAHRASFLDPDNWVFTAGEEMTSDLQGATPGHGQEFPDELMHPHLELGRTMVHIPDVEPGDFVVWHCDSEFVDHPPFASADTSHSAIHAVDRVHQGMSDSSVLYIPVCPVTEQNARYLVRQRVAFQEGTPGPDNSGGKGESEHVGRPTKDAIQSADALRAMGMEELSVKPGSSEGARAAIHKANSILGF